MAKFAISYGFLVFHFILLIVTIRAQSNVSKGPKTVGCTTPGGKSGICVSIHRCKELLDMLEGPQTPAIIFYLKSSQCDIRANLNDAIVCCDGIITSGTNRPPIPVPTHTPKLPSLCQFDVSPDIYESLGITGLSQSPWTVIFEYNEPNGTLYGCGGALLNERYVLTAAHCLKDRSIPHSVRLGEYDLSRMRDCIFDGIDGEDCSNDPIDIPIEEHIIHELYQPTVWDHQHDIALVRLAWPVQFTTYIKPVWLPTVGRLPSNLIATGWGHDEIGTTSNVKLKLDISLADLTVCSRMYRDIGVSLGISHLCLGGQPGKDSCLADYASPLLYSERVPDGRRKWTVVGIGSFGSIPCSMPNWPGVYTKVIDYVSWIRRKIRP